MDSVLITDFFFLGLDTIAKAIYKREHLALALLEFQRVSL